MGGWVDGWMDGWVGGWMDGWMDVNYRSLTLLSLWHFNFTASNQTKPRKYECMQKHVLLN